MNRFPLTAFYVLATLHVPLGHFFGLPLHWAAWCICMLLAILETDLVRAPANPFFLAYLALLIVAGMLSLYVLPMEAVALGSLSYLLLPLLFLVALQRDTMLRVRSIAKANTVIAIVAGMAAFYQLRVDPLLFGIYAGTSYETMYLWATPRAASLFDSQQVYSAFMVFSVIMYDAFLNRGRVTDWFILAFIATTSLLSGSVAAVAGIGIYVMVRTFISNRTAFWTVGLLSAFGISALMMASGLLEGMGTRSPFYRLVSIVNGGLGNVERLDRWQAAFTSTPPLTGHGIGSASTLVDGAGRFNTESYLLNIYYEGGIVLLGGFALLVGKLVFTNVPGLRAQRLGFLAAFVLTAAVVHAFYAWALPVIWVLLFGMIALGRGVTRTSATPASVATVTAPSR